MKTGPDKHGRPLGQQFVRWQLIRWQFIPWQLIRWQLIQWQLIQWQLIQWQLIRWQLIRWQLVLRYFVSDSTHVDISSGAPFVWWKFAWWTPHSATLCLRAGFFQVMEKGFWSTIWMTHVSNASAITTLSAPWFFLSFQTLFYCYVGFFFVPRSGGKYKKLEIPFWIMILQMLTSYI